MSHVTLRTLCALALLAAPLAQAQEATGPQPTEVQATGPQTPEEQATEQQAAEQTATEKQPEPAAPAQAATQQPAPAEDDTALTTDTVQVRTSILQDASKEEVFEHSGGRTLVEREEIEQRGAQGLPEVLRRQPGVKVVEASGTGNTDTKLNIGIRGMDPRLSGRSTVLLDEVPIVSAPYGQPQVSLFPVSVFSIESIDIVRGGAAMRYGPQTVGGVINLRTRAIPESLESRALLQADQYGGFLGGVSVGDTIGKLGVLAEYSYRGGQGYRQHSGLNVNAGLLKLQYDVDSATRISAMLHAYGEDSQLPGGLPPEIFEQDPRTSVRTYDAFEGTRLGATSTVSHQFGDTLRGEVIGFYNRSARSYTMGDNPITYPGVMLMDIPRTYEVVGVEPRLGWRQPLGGVLLEGSAGYRYIFEAAHQERTNRPLEGGTATPVHSDDDQTAAHAVYAEGTAWLLEQTLKLSGGVRYEYIHLRTRDNLKRFLKDNITPVLLPGASVWWTPREELSLYAAYSRSFGSPQYSQVAARGNRNLLAETADTVEVGGKVMDWKGVEASLTGFLMRFQDQIDCDESTCDNEVDSVHRGLESKLWVDLGEWVPALARFEFESGYTFTYAKVVRSSNTLYVGKWVPWVPMHSVWSEIAYNVPLASPNHTLRLVVDGWWEPEQYTDKLNTTEPTPQQLGSVGLIPAATVFGFNARYAMPISRSVAMEVRAGLKNALNTFYYERTDDRNQGLLLSRPFTAWASLSFKWDPAGLPVEKESEE